MVFATKDRKHRKYRGLWPVRPFGALRASPPSTTASIWASIYTDTLLQTDDVKHRSLYTEQLLSAHTLAQRGLCTEKLLHRRLYTQRNFFCTQKLLQTDALHKDASAPHSITHRCLHTDALHRDAFTHRRLYTEKQLHRTALAHEVFLSLSPQKKSRKEVFEFGLFLFLSFPFQIMYAISWMTLGYPRIFVCPLDPLSAFYAWHDANARPFSTDRRRYAQQPLHRAAFIRTCSYTEKLLHTDASISYTKAFTQSGFYTQKRALRPNLHCCLNFCPSFCFLFLITYLSCSLSQVESSIIITCSTKFISFCLFPMLCLKTRDNHWMEWLLPIFRHPSHIDCIFCGCFLMSTRWCPMGSVVGL